MTIYRDSHFGTIYSYEEIKNVCEDVYKNEPDVREKYETLEAYMEHNMKYLEVVLEKDCRARYAVYWVGKDRDGEVLFECDDLDKATSFADDFFKAHEDEFDGVWGGLGICDNENPDELIEW